MKMSVPQPERDAASATARDSDQSTFRVAGRPRADVELALRVKNEEATLAERLGRVTRLLASLDQSRSVVVVDCGSVDHSVDVALSVIAPEVPIHVISCAESTEGWMAAAASTSSAATIAFVAQTQRVHLLAHTRLLIGDQSIVVATTEAVSGFRFLYRHHVAWPAHDALALNPITVELVHMETTSAARLFADAPLVATLPDAVNEAIARSLVVRELRIYQPPRPAVRTATGGRRAWTIPR